MSSKNKIDNERFINKSGWVYLRATVSIDEGPPSLVVAFPNSPSEAAGQDGGWRVKRIGVSPVVIYELRASNAVAACSVENNGLCYIVTSESSTSDSNPIYNGVSSNKTHPNKLNVLVP